MTAGTLVHRTAVALARTTLHRLVETVFVVVDSVAAGQMPELVEEAAEDELLA